IRDHAAGLFRVNKHHQVVWNVCNQIELLLLDLGRHNVEGIAQHIRKFHGDHTDNRLTRFDHRQVEQFARDVLQTVGGAGDLAKLGAIPFRIASEVGAEGIYQKLNIGNRGAEIVGDVGDHFAPGAGQAQQFADVLKHEDRTVAALCGDM